MPPVFCVIGEMLIEKIPFITNYDHSLQKNCTAMYEDGIFYIKTNNFINLGN